MTQKSTSTGYGRVTQGLHWISALLILTLIPMGFWMQSVAEADKLAIYRMHAVLGIMVLLLTLVRLANRWFEPSPAPPPGLTGGKLLAFKGVHVLLYLALLVLTISGIGLNLTSGLSDILFGGAPGPIPDDFSQFTPRIVHGLMARIYIGLLIAHIGGVITYQMSEGDTLGRMGLRGWVPSPKSE